MDGSAVRVFSVADEARLRGVLAFEGVEARVPYRGAAAAEEAP
jgi:hypothetical protein